MNYDIVGIVLGKEWIENIEDKDKWMPCDSRLLPKYLYKELTQAIGNTYGGNENNIALPSDTGLYIKVRP